MLETFLDIKNNLRVYFEESKLSQLSSLLQKEKNVTVIIQTLRYSENGQPLQINNLESLKDLNIKRLLIVGHGINDFSGLSYLKKLTELDVSVVSDLNYDFSNNTKLKTLDLTWTKHVKNLAALVNLEELRLSKYESKDNSLSAFSELNKLKSLYLLQSKISDISVLSKLERLNHVSLVQCPNINFEKGKKIIFSNIQSLYIEKCKNINSLSLKCFPNLKKLVIQSQPPIASLGPILTNLKKLSSLSVNGTKIIEADNRYWKDFKNIKEFSFYTMRHHIIKERDFK